MLKKLAIDSIQPNRHQPRKYFDDRKISELADSIANDGLVQPITVRKIDDGSEGIEYELVAGERRWRACKMLDMPRIDAYVKEDVNDEQSERIALIENIQREDLSPIEISFAVSKLIEKEGMTQTDLAAKIGKSRAWVTNMIRLQKLPELAQELVSKGVINGKTALHMLGLPDDVQNDLAQKAASSDWDDTTMRQNVAKAKKRVDRQATPSNSETETSGEEPDIEFDEQFLFMVDCGSKELRQALAKEFKSLLKEAEMEGKVEIVQGIRIRQYLRSNGYFTESRNSAKQTEQKQAETEAA